MLIDPAVSKINNVIAGSIENLNLEVLYSLDNDKSIDAFTYHILERIDPKIKKSMSPAQFSAIKEAVIQNKPKHHSVDLRGEIPLFFSRFYFVFVMGRDSRFSREKVEFERRKYTSFMSNLFFLIIAISPMILIMLIFWFLLISLPGIYHFIDNLILRLLNK